MQCIKTRIEWLKRIIAALTGTCIFGDAVTFINKDCRVLFGDIFIVPFCMDEQWLLSKHCRYQAFSRLKINSQTGSSLGMDRDVQLGVGKFGCN